MNIVLLKALMDGVMAGEMFGNADSTGSVMVDEIYANGDGMGSVVVDANGDGMGRAMVVRTCLPIVMLMRKTIVLFAGLMCMRR